MASEIKSDKLSPSTGTALQIGDASILLLFLLEQLLPLPMVWE